MYSQTVSIPCYMEYSASVDQSKLAEIRSIMLTEADYPEGIDLKDINNPENKDRIGTIKF
jgi:hypothetical protein